MDVVAQHTCKGSRCDASPKKQPDRQRCKGILLDCYRDAWGHGMPPNNGVERPARQAANLRMQI